ncbi:MAG: response regulator [Desulfosarcinaceae bacterium]
MQILIVEDDFISRSLLKKMLEEMGHDVLEAQDGKQGWASIQKHKCRLMITDWMMPEMDGLELCRRVRAASTEAYVYVIMLTAKDRTQDLVHVLQAGADDYIPKPFDPDEMNARVLTGIRVLDLEDRHKKLQSTLIESRNKLRIVFDSLRELIVSVEPGFTIVSANKAFIDMVSSSPTEIVGQNCQDLIENSALLRCFLSDLKSIVNDAFSEGRVRNLQLKGCDTSGGATCLQVACLPIKDDLMRTFQTVIVMKDITEDQRKAEEIQALNKRLLETSVQIEAKNIKLENALKRLEDTQAQMLQSEKMASIGQLAAGVAHEINNPTGFVSSNLKTLSDYQNDIIALLGGYREIVQELTGMESLSPSITTKVEEMAKMEADIDIEFLMEDMADLIGDCREGTERIKKIIMDLKDFAHPGEDTVQSTDINRGLDSTLNVVNNEIKYKATVHRDFGDIPSVRGFPQQVNQVFMNILVNAAQSIENSGDIHIATRTVDSQVEITIRDTGCGISQENIPKIFDPFFTTKEVGKGTGLGMNIAYKIIEKHKGTISVQSQVGEGTVFTIRLPAEGDGAPAQDVMADTPPLSI